MSSTFLALAATALLCACSFEPSAQVDQCLRAERFQACMAALPAGPQSTKYNDWDEVVKECDGIAYYQSLRRPNLIKPECRV